MAQPRRHVAAPRQERSKATLETILSAALRVLDERGREQMGMREVARAANVSTGTLYQYFPNKESLLHALEKQSWQELYQRIQDKINAHENLDRPNFERIVRIIEIAVAEILVSIGRFGMSPLEELPPETMEQREQFTQWLGGSLPTIFERANAKLLPKNPVLAARLCFQMVVNLTKAATIDKPPELATGEYAHEVGIIIARYLMGTDDGTDESARKSLEDEHQRSRPPST
jgi:AcrR family transcriptional regulator